MEVPVGKCLMQCNDANLNVHDTDSGCETPSVPDRRTQAFKNSYMS